VRVVRMRPLNGTSLVVGAAVRVTATNATWSDDPVEAFFGRVIEVLDGEPWDTSPDLAMAVAVSTPIVLGALVWVMLCLYGTKFSFRGCCSISVVRWWFRAPLSKLGKVASVPNQPAEEHDDGDGGGDNGGDGGGSDGSGGDDDDRDDDDGDDDDNGGGGGGSLESQEVGVPPSSSRACCTAVANALITSSTGLGGASAPISKPPNLKPQRGPATVRSDKVIGKCKGRKLDVLGGVRPL
jgi:hypothetical protein